MSYALVGEFTVKAARNRGNIPNTNGPGELTRWYVDFVDANGEPVKDANGKVADAYWQRKPDAEVKPGDTVYGTITEGQYGLRFKMEKKPDGSYGGSGGSSGGGKAREWKPESQYDPEKTARIGRAHAQGMAVEVCKAMGIFEGNSAEQIYSKLLGWISWFAADVDQAGKTANQAEGPAPQQVGAAPLPDASPSPDSQAVQQVSEAFNAVPDDTAQYLDHILDNAGVMDSDERHHLVSAWEGLKPEDGRSAEQRRNAVVKGIETTDLEARAVALKRLREIAGPLPAGKPEDEIPF